MVVAGLCRLSSVCLCLVSVCSRLSAPCLCFCFSASLSATLCRFGTPPLPTLLMLLCAGGGGGVHRRPRAKAGCVFVRIVPGGYSESITELDKKNAGTLRAQDAPASREPKETSLLLCAAGPCTKRLKVAILIPPTVVAALFLPSVVLAALSISFVLGGQGVTCRHPLPPQTPPTTGPPLLPPRPIPPGMPFSQKWSIPAEPSVHVLKTLSVKADRFCLLQKCCLLSPPQTTPPPPRYQAGRPTQPGMVHLTVIFFFLTTSCTFIKTIH